MKVAIIDGSLAYRQLFIKMGHVVVQSIKDADFACFTGGEDVSPDLYGHVKHATTYSSAHRDEKETEDFNLIQSRGMPSVGICRGGQFLNVMSGGTMYQDCGRHTAPHTLLDHKTGKVITVTSTHHQMMKPSDNAIIIATANEGGYRTWWEEGEWKREDSPEDYEVLYYPDTASLCFQPHPEMMLNSKAFNPMFEYFNRLVNEYLFPDAK